MSSRPTGAFAVPLALALLGGCQESTVPVEGVYHPTLVAVAPSEFLGPIPSEDAPGTSVTIPCLPTAGAMRSYVATVFNVEYHPDGSLVTADDSDVLVGTTTPGVVCDADADPGTLPRAKDGFALPSTAPVDCTTPVAVSRVIEGQRYRARVDGYDRADLVPLAPGVNVMVDPATGVRVTPSWQMSCGDDCPARVHGFVTNPIGNCKLLHSVAPPSGPTSVFIAPTALTGASCGTESGQVEHVEVSYDGVAPVSSACGEQIQLDDVPARGTLKLSVLAYEAGKSEARWGTICTAEPVANLSVPATCEPLHEQGALDLLPADALAVFGYDCSALLSLPGELELTLVDDGGLTCTDAQDPNCGARYVDATSCERAVRFSGVKSGQAHVRARLLSGPTELAQTLCNADVPPAGNAQASCPTEP